LAHLETGHLVIINCSIKTSGQTEGDHLHRPHCCPICNEYRIKTTLEECDITAKFKGENREVQGLASFSCENGHIFFVRMSDLVMEPPPLMARDSV
jgi:hypothetical protein